MYASIVGANGLEIREHDDAAAGPPGLRRRPSVCRVGDAVYLVSSNFEYGPGPPIHRSRDLREWVLVGHAAADLGVSTHGKGPRRSGGLLAPTLRHHDGLFWLTTPLADGRGHLVMHAEDPAGPWSVPVRLPDARRHRP